jgi:hypothetical protein
MVLRHLNAPYGPLALVFGGALACHGCAFHPAEAADGLLAHLEASVLFAPTFYVWVALGLLALARLQAAPVRLLSAACLGGALLLYSTAAPQSQSTLLTSLLTNAPLHSVAPVLAAYIATGRAWAWCQGGRLRPLSLLCWALA